MIINIQGTDGPGELTLVRKIMAKYTGKRFEFEQPNHRQPFGYICFHPTAKPLVFITGGYNTIKSYKEVRDIYRGGCNVLCEGIDAQLMAKLALEHPALTIGLNVPPGVIAKFQELKLQAEWHNCEGAFKRICEVLEL